MRSSRPLVIIAVSLLLFFGVAGTVGAFPPIPYFPWGTVTVDGQLAKDGTRVVAWIGEVQLASATTIQGYYSLDVPADDPDTPEVMDGGVLGDSVVFMVDGRRANETGTWASGDSSRLDLTVGSPTATATPEPYWFNGYVYDEDTGEGIRGATVKLYRWTGAEWLEINANSTSEAGIFGLWAPARAGRYLRRCENRKVMPLKRKFWRRLRGVALPVSCRLITLPETSISVT